MRVLGAILLCASPAFAIQWWGSDDDIVNSGDDDVLLDDDNLLPECEGKEIFAADSQLTVNWTYHHLGRRYNVTTQTSSSCEFVKNWCHEDAVQMFAYLKFHFCNMEAFPVASIVIQVCWLIMLLSLLGGTSANFLVPSLETLSDYLMLSPAVAGVTLLAFGNVAADMFASKSALNRKGGNFPMMFGAIIGSSVFVTTVVLACVCLVANGTFGQSWHVDKVSFWQNYCFLVLTLTTVLYITADGEITQAEPLAILAVYFGYITLRACFDVRKNLSSVYSVSRVSYRNMEQSDGINSLSTQEDPTPPASNSPYALLSSREKTISSSHETEEQRDMHYKKLNSAAGQLGPSRHGHGHGHAHGEQLSGSAMAHAEKPLLLSQQDLIINELQQQKQFLQKREQQGVLNHEGSLNVEAPVDGSDSMLRVSVVGGQPERPCLNHKLKRDGRCKNHSRSSSATGSDHSAHSAQSAQSALSATQSTTQINGRRRRRLSFSSNADAASDDADDGDTMEGLDWKPLFSPPPHDPRRPFSSFNKPPSCSWRKGLAMFRFVILFPFSVLRWLTIPSGDKRWSRRRRVWTSLSIPGACVLSAFNSIHTETNSFNFVTFLTTGSPNYAGSDGEGRHPTTTFSNPPPYDDDKLRGREFPLAHAYSPVGGVPLVPVVLAAGAAVGMVVYLCSSDDKLPRFYLLLVVCSFVASIMWVDLIAGELVAVLQGFGIMLDMSTNIIGLTVLGAGNGCGDLASNITVARRRPKMAVAACFGAPMIVNTLAFGFAVLWYFSAHGHMSILTPLSAQTRVAYIFLFFGLLVTGAVFALNDYRPDARNIYAYSLLALYVLFLVVLGLIEADIILKKTICGWGTSRLDTIDSCIEASTS